MAYLLRELLQEVRERILLVCFALAVMIVFLFMADAQGQAAPPTPLRGSILDMAQFRGQLWSYAGTSSPTEPNNILSQTYVEQTAAVFSGWNNSLTLTPYAAFGFSMDTQGDPWNRSVQPSFGIKANKFFRYGSVSVGTAYSYQNRFGASSAHGETAYILDWFGWNTIGDKRSRFPGSTWAIIGHFTPVEPGNLIEQGYITQGFVLRRFGTSALVPYSEVTYSHDSKRYDWENKAVEGAGVKYGMSKDELYVDVGVGYMHETRFNSGLSAGGMKVFMDVSYTWKDLFGRSTN